MLKDMDFMARFAYVGEGAQVFEHALVLGPEAISIGAGSRIDDYCRLEGGQRLELGRYVHVSSFVSIFGGGTCLVGDGVGLAGGGRVICGSDQADAVMSAVAPAQWRHVERYTNVLDHLSFVATNSTVLPGVSLGMGAILAAGAVATKDIPAWEVWGGVPARRVAARDPEPLRARGVPLDELAARSLLNAA
jgi:acetyltransferase-like isoleucine patch superfamily enzyme